MIAIPIALLVVTSCIGQESSVLVSYLDSVILSAIHDGKIQGAVALVANHNTVLYHKAHGKKNIAKDIPQEKTDLFRIASMTKPITAVAAMILYEQGKFKLDDPLSKFIPEFANPEILIGVDMRDSSFTSRPASKEITIRQLFTHSSGIGYGFQDEKLMALYEKAGITEGFEERDILLEDNVVNIARIPIMHEPGERFTYGLNSDVLGRLVEIWSGMPLDEAFRNMIFEPLDMYDTHFYLPESEFHRLADVYMTTPNGVAPTDYPLTKYPVQGAKRYLSGGSDLCSTSRDYHRFCQMMINNGVLDGVRLLKRKTVKLIASTHLETGDEDMGLGFSYLSAKSHDTRARSVGTYSGGGFFATQFWIDPEADIVAILMLQLYPFDHWDLFEELEIAIYEAKAKS